MSENVSSGIFTTMEDAPMITWIPVTDRLPDNNNEVWCFDSEEGVVIGTYHPRFEWSDVYGEGDGMRDSRLYSVTYWALLERPNPPL